MTSHKSELCSHYKKHSEFSCRVSSHSSSTHRASSLLYSTWNCRALHHSFCMLCLDILFPSLSPLSTCTLSCCTGRRQGTCEVEEVKAEVAALVLVPRSPPWQLSWGWTPPCWCRRGGKQRGSPNPQAAASADQVLMGLGSFFVSFANMDLQAIFRFEDILTLFTLEKFLINNLFNGFFFRNAFTLRWGITSWDFQFFLQKLGSSSGISSQGEWSSSSSSLEESKPPSPWCPKRRRSCYQGSRWRRRLATC